MIRIPDVPGLQGQQINSPTASMAAANAPNAALGSLAQSIAGVGEQFQAVADRTQQMENARLESEARQKLETDTAAFQQAEEQNPDAAGYVDNARKFFSERQADMNNPDLPPVVRDRLKMYYDERAHKGILAAGERAASVTSKRAGLALTNEIEVAKESGDAAMFQRAMATGRENNLILPEQSEKLQRDFDHTQKIRSTQQDIVDDPAGWLAENPADKVPAGYDPVSWQNQRGFARGQLREKSYEATESINDGIAEGKITTAKQIDEMSEDIRPAAREALKANLLEINSEGFKARAATPEYQQATVGRVAALLADYSPESKGFDKDFADMDALVRTLPLGAVRSELKRQITAVRDGATKEIKNHFEAGNQALNEAFKAGRFAEIPTGKIMPTDRAINDGFLRDPEKLQSLGFSEEQAESIIGDDETTDNQRKQLFKTTWIQRPGEGKPASVSAATARAILEGKETVDVTDKEMEDRIVSAKMQAELVYGRVQTDFTEWGKRNPDASGKEVEDKIFSLAGDEARRRVSTNVLPAKPTRGGSGPKGADDSTSAIPKGKNLTEMVKNFEAGGAQGGFHREAYWDYGQWSIGYGTKSRKGETIGQAEADQRLASELASHRTRVEKASAKAGIGFSPQQLDALTSFDYNTGSIEMLLAGGTRSKAEIADTMLLYRNADGKRLRGLESRRAAERHLFLHGPQADS